MACCTCNLSITALCKLDLLFRCFPPAPADGTTTFADAVPSPKISEGMGGAAAADVLPAGDCEMLYGCNVSADGFVGSLERMLSGTMIGVLRGGGGHCGTYQTRQIQATVFI